MSQSCIYIDLDVSLGPSSYFRVFNFIIIFPLGPTSLPKSSIYFIVYLCFCKLLDTTIWHKMIQVLLVFI
jgi:hypothetical protein